MAYLRQTVLVMTSRANHHQNAAVDLHVFIGRVDHLVLFVCSNLVL